MTMAMFDQQAKWCVTEKVLMQKIGSEFTGVRKGAWTQEEDLLLKKCIEKYGEGQWHLVPTRAGDLDDVSVSTHMLSLGRIPGRTANDIKNFWNSCLGKKVSPNLQDVVANKETAGSTALKQSRAGIKKTVPPVAPSYFVVKPKPRIPSKSIGFPILPKNIGTHREARREPPATDDRPDKEEDPLPWLRNLLGVEEEEVEEDGKQKQLQQGPEQEQEMILYSFPCSSQASEVDFLVKEHCREEVGSDEGQWRWEDMFLDEELMLGDLLGPESGSKPVN
ncbi:hypothetical protein Taro_012472 [Colocasia esculenta]|uniref:Uncharacterized protein n=1 Tax=Colocasia esculenta TaxID=4460 RepID=A0A843UJ85_COLES|nr:hypothetical protein [Colocasia esculenta]